MESAGASLPQCDILGMGNPLLDISSVVDPSFIKKYELKMGNACLAEKQHMPMYEEMQKMDSVEYIPGGATLNTIRVAQWAGGRTGATAYIGCIGNDENGKRMQSQLKAEGIYGAFRTDADEATGTCAVCVVDNERSLVANLAAANKYQESHFTEVGRQLAMRARIIYSAGFFLTVSPSTMLEAARITSQTGALFTMNLSAEFIVQFFAEAMGKCMALCDIVFGNETEAAAYAKANGLASDTPAAVARHLACNVPFEKPGRQRVAVITCGADHTVLARGDGLFIEVPVAKLEKERIVDVNAAGDSFVGGFLAALQDGKDYVSCIENGHRCSRFIIQRSGCNLGAQVFSDVVYVQ